MSNDSPESLPDDLPPIHQQLEALQHQVALLRRTNECLCQENQDLQQGRNTLLTRLALLEQAIDRDRQHTAQHSGGDQDFAQRDRWLLQTTRADYTQLKALLARQDWEAADTETQRVMLQVGGAEAQAQGFLTAEHLRDFPCLDLKILNKLWMIYSNDKYGFMAQREIWSRTHSTRNLWHSPEMDGYYPRREGLGHSLAQRLLCCALDDF